MSADVEAEVPADAINDEGDSEEGGGMDIDGEDGEEGEDSEEGEGGWVSEFAKKDWDGINGAREVWGETELK